MSRERSRCQAPLWWTLPLPERFWPPLIGAHPLGPMAQALSASARCHGGGHHLCQNSHGLHRALRTFEGLKPEPKSTEPKSTVERVLANGCRNKQLHVAMSFAALWTLLTRPHINLPIIFHLASTMAVCVRPHVACTHKQAGQPPLRRGSAEV